MDSIEQAIKERTQQLEREQIETQEAHRIKMAALKTQEDKARAQKAEAQRLSNEKAERRKQFEKVTQEAQRRQELQRRAAEETEANLRLQEIEKATKLAQKLEADRINLERMEEKAAQDKKDAEALLVPKVDTERIVPHPLARFLQQSPD